MTLAARIIEHTTYPLWLRRTGLGDVKRLLGEYRELDELSAEQIEARQWRLVESVWRFAATNCEYFRENEMPDVSDIENLAEDWPDIPLLTKQIIRENFNALLPDGVDIATLSPASTGGSTGTPLRFMRSAEVFSARKAQELYYEQWMGYRPGDRGALFVAASHHEGALGHLKAKIRNATFERLLRFDPSNPTTNYLEQFYSEFCEYRPLVIKCFPNSLMVFAAFLADRGYSVPPVKAISCTGESLYDWQRDFFEKIFDAKVYERYATKEAGIIAAECVAGDGLHIFTDGSFVEVLDDNGRPAEPGTIGRIVVTDLVNRGTPLIRYDIGDLAEVAAVGPCACGSNLPKLARVIGRDRDILIDSNGVMRPGYLFVEAINKRNLDGKFQIVQESRGLLRVLLERGHSVSADDLAELKQAYQVIMGDSIGITIDEVDSIRRDPSGKYRYVVSRIDPTKRISELREL